MVRRVRGSDAGVFRDVRLRALREAPYAFEQTAEEIEGDPFEEWVEWVSTMAEPSVNAATYLAFADDSATSTEGMAGGFLDPADPTAVVLWGVWVDPRSRGRGNARQLVQAVTEWARRSGRSRLTLWVTSTSDAAIGLYLSEGFTQTSRSREHATQPEREEIFMERGLV